MQLHFFTRDLQLDYPRIGWLPPLPTGTDELWQQFAKYLLHAGEYPEVILSQEDGKWSLYLSAIPGGRTDSIGGQGRVIRVSLFLSGKTAEGKEVSGLIETYLEEMFGNKEKFHPLQDLFHSTILPGDPQKWRTEPLEEQKRHAEPILTAVRQMQGSQLESHPFKAWAGGVALPENRAAFLAFCHALLTGDLHGTAISLANLDSSEIGHALQCCGYPDHAAILLTTPAEKQMPGQEHALPPASSISHKRSGFAAVNIRKWTESDNKKPFPLGEKKFRGIILLTVGLLILVGTVIIFLKEIFT